MRTKRSTALILICATILMYTVIGEMTQAAWKIPNEREVPVLIVTFAIMILAMLTD